MHTKKAALHSLGCKVNAYETEAMQQLLEKAGYEIVPFEPGADVYVINTCTVTNIADRKSRQMLHRAKKMNPDAIVIATGCYAQISHDRLTEDAAVDLVLGNDRKTGLVEAIEEYQKNRQKKEDVIVIAESGSFEPLRIEKTAEHVRAFIKVCDGCNQFCSYCLIPYARGRVRSRKPEEILEEIRVLAAKGYQEVVLTGIHLSSYGMDFAKGEKSTLLNLIEAVHQVEGIERIRLGSLEPGIITEDFVHALSRLDKICPHFHLSLQSGCDRTLERMNRRYRSGDFMEKTQLLRSCFDDPAITTDIIVGFPQESDEDFQESMDFIEKVRFYETHIFKYSKRDGTRAASMEGQIPEAEKTRRSEQLLALNKKRIREYEERWTGKTLEVLIEESKKIEGRLCSLGHSREYIPIALASQERVNDRVFVRTTGFLTEHLLLGEKAEK
ncbi:MAG: tRNA (N(6)-L-threonylcarbamoyladenosine(37)-C(2))-methylthiotransferase MtaB [Blautia sp.]|nr:tRNA (N(6)-L-threonylcarbamoyladenosine(37)-C(2))-methylthiotransferase MtaB [Blautia sp.]